MKKLLWLVLLLAFVGMLPAQALFLRHEVNFPFVTNAQGNVGSSDCWGWTDSMGVDYAIVGNSDHVAFVRASDGVVLDTVQLSSNFDGYYHRDFKTAGHYCFAACEMSGRREGIAVIDLQYLPDSVHFVTAFNAGGTLIRSHNLDADEGRPYLYAESDEQLGPGGVDIINISDPENLFKEGFMAIPNTHDMNARNDTVWVAEGYTKAFSVYNCVDKGNPILMGRVTSPAFGYCHNIWPSDDGKFFFTTEETAGKSLKVWDATDMNNIVQRGQYLGANNLAHNVHVQGNLLFISHYTAGITVVDWSAPDQPVEIARYDTYTTNDVANFFGCWGAFPYTQNGYIYASNFDGKLFILDWDPNAVGISEPRNLDRSHCWPNPFASTTNIPLVLTRSESVNVTVYDLQGKQVALVFEGNLEPGNYTLPWHPSYDCANGIYNVQMVIGEQQYTEKLILQR